MKVRNRNRKRKLHLNNNTGGNLILIIVLLAIDFLSKRFLAKDIVQNNGIIFGFFNGTANSNAIMIGASIAAAIIIGFIIWFSRARAKKLYAIILAGILGNLIDRITLGYVVDWIRMPLVPTFNVADACISVGVVLLILHGLIEDKFRSKNINHLMNRLE